MEAKFDPKKLIINYLPQKMTDQEFTDLFAACGTTTTTKIMRDRSTGYSFGYGFVDYSGEDEAAKAIEKLNGWKIGDKKLKVAYSKPQEKSAKNVNLFLSGLGTATTEESLKELFGQYGTIVNTKIVRDKTTNESKGTGFVLFTKKEEADAAMKNLQGHSDDAGMALQIKHAKESSEQQRNHPAFQAYLQKQGFHGNPHQGGYFPQQPQFANAGWDSYGYDQAYGGGYGQGMGGGARGNGRGGIMRGGQRFNPLSRPQGGQMPAGPTHTLFVYNIGKDAQEKDMYSVFAQYGRITKVDVMHGKGFAFVHMPVWEEANFAMQNTNGMYFNPSGKTLQVSFKTS